MYQLFFSETFLKQLNKLIKRNPSLESKTKNVVKLLQQDLQHPKLRLHKLSGRNNWSVSVTRDIRIILHWQEGNLYCLRIGTHDEVY